MPTGESGRKFFERLIVLETKVANVMTFQKWQMALLALIFMAALRAAVKQVCPMYLGRKCSSCGNTRIPDERTVTEKKVKYVIYKCPICKMQDIEHFDEHPRHKFWNGTTWEDDGGGYPFLDPFNTKK